MSPSQTAVKVWGQTILLATLLLFLAACFQDGWEILGAVLMAFLTVFCGFFMGMPFLLLTIVLISVIRKLPYSAAGRVMWVFVIESVIVALFFALIEYQMDGRFGLRNTFFQLMTGTTIAAFLFSLWLNRRGFADDKGIVSVSINTPGATSTSINSAS